MKKYPIRLGTEYPREYIEIYARQLRFKRDWKPKTVPYFRQKRKFFTKWPFYKKKVILFTMKNAMFFDFLIGDSKFMANKKLRFFDENSISKVLKKLFSGLVMWQSDSICSTMSIFDSIWKLNLKTSEFSRLLIQIRKRTKTLKFVFQNIKKWTCEFSPAYFLEKWQIWTKNQHGTFESKISNSK